MFGIEYPQEDSILRTLCPACCTYVPGVSPLLQKKAGNPLDYRQVKQGGFTSGSYRDSVFIPVHTLRENVHKSLKN